jgi:hypothetical protein
MCSGPGGRGRLLGVGIRTVPRWHSIVEFRADSTAFWWSPSQHTVGSAPSTE